MTRLYIRTCQECGKRHDAKPVTKYASEVWRDTKCKRCKSEALDYGSYQEVDPKTLKSIPGEDYTKEDDTP